MCRQVHSNCFYRGSSIAEIQHFHTWIEPFAMCHMRYKALVYLSFKYVRAANKNMHFQLIQIWPSLEHRFPAMIRIPGTSNLYQTAGWFNLNSINSIASLFMEACLNHQPANFQCVVAWTTPRGIFLFMHEDNNIIATIMPSGGSLFAWARRIDVDTGGAASYLRRGR